MEYWQANMIKCFQVRYRKGFLILIMEQSMEDEDEEINYENKHLADVTDPHEPSEEQYLESLEENTDLASKK